MPQTRSAKAILSHQERTATEHRDKDLHTAIVSKVTPVNDRIKTFRFDIKNKNGFNFLPGQWLDVFVPDIEKAGGFTITSSPREALPQTDPEHKPYFELAIQKSPDNPPAAWLWQPVEQIQGKEINVRVGGSFVFPPPDLDAKRIKRAVFIAGGVGINPIMSMLSYINHTYPNLEVRLLYSTKVPSRETDQSEVLYLPEIIDLFRIPRTESTRDRIELFFTGTRDGSDMGTDNEAPINPLMALTLPNIDSHTEVPVLAWTHRIDESALSSAIGDEKQAQSSVFYVCGPPDMTDDIVKILKEQEHVKPERVLCEKWW
ncbi:Nn.00g038940.m01.CDS01 [Neocucurbitaria sp. VM-36]